MNSRFRSTIHWLGLCAPVLWGVMGSVCAAGEYVEGFDTNRPSWKLSYDATALKVLAHRRNTHVFYKGNASENVEVASTARLTGLRLEHSVPPSRLLEESVVSLWFRSSQKDARIAVRILFPYTVDPSSGNPLSTTVTGDKYTKVGTWQKLACKNLLSQVKEKLPRLRSYWANLGLRGEIDLREPYVESVFVDTQLPQGASEYFLDELTLNPIVTPSEQTGTQVVQTAGEMSQEIEFRLKRLYFQGVPLFPRFLPYHSEKVSDLSGMRLNVIWVPDYTDKTLLRELQENGLRATATPPRVTGPHGELLDESRASLAPFGPDTSSILFWNLGTRIPGTEENDLSAWAEQIRNADRHLKRPLMADVSSNEAAYSRILPMLGVSRHILHSSFGLKDYRNWLIERRNASHPGSFVWTWIQTEPVQAIADDRRAAYASEIVVEPEQIRLQTYAALSAGCRGIGFWTQSSLDDDSPGALERKLVIAQLCMELELLEPLLATGSLQTHVKFTANMPRGQSNSQLAIEFGHSSEATRKRSAQLNERDNELRRTRQLAQELEAAIIRTDYGLLLLPVWYGQGAQFVPGQMAANDAKIIVEGADESASAWEISTTGIRNLRRERVTGGVQIPLSEFDMTSAVILCTDPTIITKLREKVAMLQQRSAHVNIELGRAKLARVAEVDTRLHDLGYRQLDAAQLLAAAGRELDKAQASFERRSYDTSHDQSRRALQALRILQSSSWADAVRRLSSPVSSSHTLCYQTLPDHWQMVARLGNSPDPGGQNLLRSGDFEDFDTMVAEGWKHEQATIDGIRASAELYPRPRKGHYCLRLVAVPDTGKDAPTVVRERPVTVTSPSVNVHAGQLLYISGWIRMPAPSVGSLDGVMLYDSLTGPAGALRWHTKNDEWQPFSIIREARGSGPVNVTLTLSGMGEACFDELRIIPFDAGEHRLPQNAARLRTPANSRSNPLEFFKRLPGMGGRAATPASRTRPGNPD